MVDNKKHFGRLIQLGESDYYDIELTQAEQKTYGSTTERRN